MTPAPEEAAMARRMDRKVALLSVLTLLFAASTLGYRWLSTSTPVTPEQAVERYQQQVRAEDTLNDDETDEGAEPAQPTPAVQDEGPSAPSAPAPQQAPSVPGPAAPAEEQPPAHADMRMPRPGVYTWKTEGWEQAGFRRNYPPHSQRIITLPDERTISNHHIFSQEHEEWFTLQTRPEGGAMLERRMRITFGPMAVDRTLTFDPPILGVPLPHQPGARWEGSWEGPTSGSYVGETVDHRTIRIGDGDVEVFVNRLEMEFRGETGGTATVHLWFAPEHGMTVREDGNYHITGAGPGPYRTEFTITLQSTEPRS